MNPPCPTFRALPDDTNVTFLPMEAVWPDERLDRSRVRPKGEVKAGFTPFEEGDLLLPKITPTFEAGRATIARGLENAVGSGTTELHVLRPHQDLDVRYAFYVLNSDRFLSDGGSEMRGVAGQKRVSDDFVRNFVLELPEPAEQREIARSLDERTARIDGLVARIERLRDALVRSRTAVVETGVAGGFGLTRSLVPSSIPWLPRIPAGWESTKIKYVAHQGTGHTPSRQHPEWWLNCDVPWVTTSDVYKFRDDRLEVLVDTEEKISQLGIENSSAVLHPGGTVVLCRTASAGYSAIMGQAMATSQDFATWTCTDRLSNEFLLYCLRAMRRDLLERLAQGSTHKTIYMPDIQALKIPLPPIEEQHEVVTAIRRRLAEIDRVVDALEGQLPKLAEYRRALITDALTGKPRVAA